MRKIIYSITSFLLVLCVCCVTSQDADANSRRKKSKKDKVESVEDKKTPYEKFMKSKDLVKKDGFFNIIKKGEDIYLEIPVNLVGHKVISSTRIENSSDPSVAIGSELSSNQVLVLENTDSLLLLRRPASALIIKDHDDHIARALGKREPIIYSFPIKYRNADSSSFVVKADKLFDISDERIVDLNGLAYDDNQVGEFSVKSDCTDLREVVSFGESVGIRKEATFEIGISVPGLGLIASEKPVATLSLLTTLSLMPEDEFSGRLSDSRIGTNHKSFRIFEADKEIDSDTWANRWKLIPKDHDSYFAGKQSDVMEPIVIYVDESMGPDWYKAVEDGIMAWQPAFDRIGLTHAIEVRPVSTSSSPMSSSPLYSMVSFVGGKGTSLSATILSDETTGRIMSCRLTIPGNYIAGVHKRAVFAISDVDSRYRSIDLPVDAVCEVLKADVMRTFGLCLGLTANMAGSAAYSPEQLRSPEFTTAHGITSSVTDDVLFNYLARPGDKEKGVVTIVDRIGAYDKYAIEWLYRPFQRNEKEQLDSIITSKEYRPEYFYAGRQRTFFDSRALPIDLGNDVFEAYESGISHLKFVVEHGHEWIQPEKVDDGYMELFYDWLWLRFYNLTFMLSSNVGAINTNDTRSGLPVMETLPIDVQKKALKMVLRGYLDADWINTNKILLHMSGAYKTTERMTMTSLLQISGLTRKLPIIAMSEKELGTGYKLKGFMRDLQTELLSRARMGQLGDNGYDIGIAKYLTWLISNSPVLKQNYKDFLSKTGKRSAFADISFRLQFSSVPAKYTFDLEEVCYESLSDAVSILRQGMRSCRSAYDKGRYEFLIAIGDAALGR